MNSRTRIQGPTIKVLLSVGMLSLIFLGESSAQSRQPPPKLSPGEATKATQAVATWFECEECESGELRAVTKYGAAVVPSLVATLKEGPSPANREVLRRQLETRFAELEASSQGRPDTKPATSKEEFIAMYMGNYEAQYRARAAQALGSIGGRQAVEALETALKISQRQDVHLTIQKAAEQAKRTKAK